MTKITYCPRCSRITAVEDHSIESAPHLDTPDALAVEDYLRAEGVLDDPSMPSMGQHHWNELFELTTMAVYEGELDEYEIEATPLKPIEGDPCPEPDCEAPLATVWLTVTVVDDEQRLCLYSCNQCGFEPERAADWEYTVSESAYGVEHRHCCPICSTTVWVDVFGVPEEFDIEYCYSAAFEQALGECASVAEPPLEEE